MKTILRAVAVVAVLGASMTGCAVYAPPIGVGVGVGAGYGPRYRYSEPPVIVAPRYYGYGGGGYYPYRRR